MKLFFLNENKTDFFILITNKKIILSLNQNQYDIYILIFKNKSLRRLFSNLRKFVKIHYGLYLHQLFYLLVITAA